MHFSKHNFGISIWLSRSFRRLFRRPFQSLQFGRQFLLVGSGHAYVVWVGDLGGLEKSTHPLSLTLGFQRRSVGGGQLWTSLSISLMIPFFLDHPNHHISTCRLGICPFATKHESDSQFLPKVDRGINIVQLLWWSCSFLSLSMCQMRTGIEDEWRELASKMN